MDELDDIGMLWAPLLRNTDNELFVPADTVLDVALQGTIRKIELPVKCIRCR